MTVKNFKPCFQVKTHSGCASGAMLFLRVVAGIAFMMHGYGKIQSPFDWMGPDAAVPGVLQFLAAISEFGGGLAWILGLLTPLASAGIGFTMVVATYMHMIVMKDPFVSSTGGRSYELALVFLAIAVTIMSFGPGKFSLDRKIFGERN